MPIESGDVFTGTASGNATTSTAMGGDLAAGTIGSAVISNGAVSLTKMANIAANCILGNNTGSPATPIELTASQVKSLLSLNNVENTALSTWAGSSNLATLGTISSGTWSAGTVAQNKGGTNTTSYTDGQLLIGNTSTGGLTAATITAGSNVTVTNGNGSITLASSVTAGTFSAAYVNKSAKTVSNTSTETTLLTETLLSFTPAAGRTLRVQLYGYDNTKTSSPGTVSLNIYKGSTLIATTGSFTIGVTSYLSGSDWWAYEALITCRSTTQMVGCSKGFFYQADTSPFFHCIASTFSTTSTISSSAENIDVKWKWDTQDTHNSLTAMTATIEVL